jgi:putative transcriptional regulator
MNRPTIVNRVRELRQQRGDMTQEDLAGQCGVTRQTIVAMETGRYSPSLELAFQVAHALDASVEKVFQWQPKSQTNKPR